MFACGGCGLAFLAGTQKPKAGKHGVSGVIKGKPRRAELLFAGLGGFVIEEFNSYTTSRLGANHHIEENTRADHSDPG